MRPNPFQVLGEVEAAQQVDLTVGKPRLYPLLQQLQNILNGKSITTLTKNTYHYLSRVSERCFEAHQSAGDADHSDGSLGGLGDVKQVVEQSLVLVVGE